MNRPDNPLALRIVAGLFTFTGVCAVIEVVLLLTRGHIDLNFGVLGLWIGPGLLRHNRTWRTWALVFLWIGLIGSPVFTLLALTRSALDFKVFGIPVGKVPNGIGLIVAAAVFLLSLWQYRVLTRPEIRRLFYGGFE